MSAFRSPKDACAVIPIWAYLAAITVVIVVIPALASLLQSASHYVRALTGVKLSAYLFYLLMFLGFSPVLSWAILLFAVPISIIALKTGVAGWATAMLVGAPAGYAAFFLLGRSYGDLPDLNMAAALCTTGAILGWSYWLTLFLFYRKTDGSQ